MSASAAAVKAERIASARLRKVQKLTAVILAAGGTSADLDDTFPWDVAVAAAGVRPPSDETKALVKEAIVFWESKPAPAVDPFKGL
jgi:hypothetical protein